MVKGILIYFLLVVCLLTKNGISLAFDVWREQVELSSLSDVEMEDTLDEEGSTEDWFNLDSHVNFVPKIPFEKSRKNSFLNRNEAELLVFLEQVSPPPRMS